jgi:hypothetical protein
VWRAPAAVEAAYMCAARAQWQMKQCQSSNQTSWSCVGLAVPAAAIEDYDVILHM